MICKAKKVLFVHIPGTAGTAIERAFCSEDWWTVNPVMKHAPLSVHAKAFRVDLRKFFVFSVVRHPYERLRSIFARFGNAYGMTLNARGEIEVEGYLSLQRARHNLYIEQQPPSSLAEIGLSAAFLPQPHHTEYSVYRNYLDGVFSRIYRYEQIGECFRELTERFDLPSASFKNRLMASPAGAKPPLSTRAKALVQQNLRMDFAEFGYEY